MKILVVNNFFGRTGAQEDIILGEIKQLQKNDHKVYFFATKYPGNMPSEYSKYFIDYYDLSNAGREYNFFKKLKIAKNIICNNQAVKNFTTMIDEVKPDLVHCHDAVRYISPVVLSIAKNKNIPVIYTLHAMKIICNEYFFLKGDYTYCDKKLCSKGGINYLFCVKNRCIKKSLLASLLTSVETIVNRGKYINNVDIFIVLSNAMKKVYEESGFPTHRLFVLNNFLDIARYSNKYNIGEYFIYFGRLSPEKGLLSLLKAFLQVPDIELRIVGKGPQEQELKDFVKSNNMKNVSFIGFCEFDELEKHIEGCIASILLTEGFEPFGKSIIESFAYGKPVIGSSSGAIPEIISHNEDGFICKRGDIGSLTSYIRLLSNNPDLAIRLGRNGRRKVEEKYTIENHYKKLMEIYNLVLNKK